MLMPSWWGVGRGGAAGGGGDVELEVGAGKSWEALRGVRACEGSDKGAIGDSSGGKALQGGFGIGRAGFIVRAMIEMQNQPLSPHQGSIPPRCQAATQVSTLKCESFSSCQITLHALTGCKMYWPG